MIIVYKVRANGRTMKFVQQDAAQAYAAANGATVKETLVPGCDGEKARAA